MDTNIQSGVHCKHNKEQIILCKQKQSYAITCNYFPKGKLHEMHSISLDNKIITQVEQCLSAV